MKTALLLGSLLLFLAGSLAGQSPTPTKGKGRLVVSTGFSFGAIEDSIDLVDNRPLHTYELYWDLRFGIDINRFSRVLLQNKFLFYKNIAEPWEVAQLVGLVHEVDVFSLFLPRAKQRLWLSGGIHRGNIRRMDNRMEHGDPWLWHAHLGLGGSLWLHPHFDLYADFGIYWSLQEVQDLQNYNHPTIGLSYYFQKRGE